MSSLLIFFFFNDTATTEIYTLSLHDALPISDHAQGVHVVTRVGPVAADLLGRGVQRRVRPAQRLCQVGDRKSTRLNSSHANISYAVFCLKKKKKKKILSAKY